MQTKPRLKWQRALTVQRLEIIRQELGVAYGHAALLCFRHKYKAKMRTGKMRVRVPIRRWLPHPTMSTGSRH